MKWIGQHIWDFISRFRSDVYLEATETGTIASGGNLGLDSNNKIVKAASGSGDLTITNAGDNRVVTSTGGTGLNGEANFTFDADYDIMGITSTGSGQFPQIQLNNENTGSVGSFIKFRKTDNGSADDELGTVQFLGDDTGGNLQSFAEIVGYIGTSTAGSEAGRLEFNVAENDGTVTTGLKIEGQPSDDGEIDVTIGAGVASTTTVAGDLDIDGDTVTSAGDLKLDTLGDISLDPHTAKDIFFKENGTERFHFHLDSTPTMDVTGAFNIQGDGQVSLQALSGDIVATASNDILLTPQGGEVVIEDDTTNKPQLTLKATAAGNKPPVISFLADRGEAGQDGDFIGTVNFKSDNDVQQEESFCQIRGTISDATDGEEAGKLELNARVHGVATQITGLSIDGNTDAAGELNVTMGAGSSTVSTSASELDLTTTGTLDVNANALDMDLTDESDILLTASEDNENLTIRLANSGGPHDTSLTLRGDGTGSQALYLYAANGGTRIFTPELLIDSTTSAKPVVEIRNTTTDGTGPTLKFNNTNNGGDAGDGDFAGKITFNAMDDGTPTETTYASIYSRIDDATSTEESGSLYFDVANHDGGLGTGLRLTGGSVNNEIDVNIGLGAGSLTTINGNLKVLGDDTSFASANSGKPLVELKTTNTTKTTSAELKFLKDAANVEDDEALGEISFYGDNDAGTPEVIQYGRILGTAADMTDGQEAGELIFSVAEYDGNLSVGLKLDGDTNADGEVDVTIGAGVASMTTIKGDLDIDGDNITTAGAMTVTTGGAGAFTIDAAAAINLDSSGTINFQAAGTTRGFFFGSANQSYLVVNGGSLNSGSILFYEDTDNGTSYTRLIGASAMGSNKTITLPDTTGTVALLDSSRSFTKTSSTHFEHQGDVLYLGGGSTTQGDLCYLKEDGEWGQADADGAATGDDADRDAMGMLAIALGDDPDVDGMLIKGIITMDYDMGDVGNPIYVKTTAGDMSHEPPTASGDFVRVLGYCLDDTNGQIYFNPDNGWVEIA